MNNIWYELKQKLFKSGNPALMYIGINVLIFVAFALLSLIFFFAQVPDAVADFINRYLAFPSSPVLWPARFYTLLTYQFFHAGVFHLLFNMLWLYWMGQIFLNFVKPRQFHFVYLGGGILGAICFALMYNLVPVFQPKAADSTLIGASAAVMAIFAAATTLVPNYTIRLLFIGDIKLKYLLLIYVVLDIIAMQSYNGGGSIAHLGGALFGFGYIKLLQNGTDLSTFFRRKPKLKVVKHQNVKKSTHTVNQKEIDHILDKISKSGYDKLTKEEKETLFKASKN